MLSVIMDFDNSLGEIKLSVLRNGITIITPTAEIGLPYLDKPDSLHLLGSNLAGTNFFNGFMFDFEIHNIVLPQIDIDLNFNLGGPSNNCGPFQTLFNDSCRDCNCGFFPCIRPDDCSNPCADPECGSCPRGFATCDACDISGNTILNALT
jgi:hypothetical protein